MIESTHSCAMPVRIKPVRPWVSAQARAIVWQVTFVAVVAAIVASIAVQTSINLRARGIASGFDFLSRPAGFEIARGLLPFSSRDTYARALLVGLFNTLRVAALGMTIAASFGLLMGVARLSGIWIVSTVARVYVEVVRNTPLLLQLLFWYTLTQGLPGPADALNLLPGVYLCFRGLFLPAPVLHQGFPWIGVEWPILAAFGFEGGTAVSPEFAALLAGLSTYTAAFIGEIVRAGILAVDRGQIDAAAAVGLSRLQALRLVVLPQALRIAVPPTTSQFLNLFKNSTLSVAIGYPDLMSITNTTLNQTGQAIEAIALAMAVYLAVCLGLSAGMNLYNRTTLRRGGGA
jgi:general L-amino acid transport system permease protein